MNTHSRVKGFYKLSVAERVKWIAANACLTEEEVQKKPTNPRLAQS